MYFIRFCGSMDCRSMMDENKPLGSGRSRIGGDLC
jgi:hypothetical protein